MTKKILTIVAAISCCAAGFAANAVTEEVTKPDGGDIKIKAEGCLVIVDTCGAASNAYETAARKLRGLLMIDVVCKRGAWSLATASQDFKAASGNVSVFITKDNSLPISLIALEARWAVVNALAMTEKQLEKEVLRVATILLGGPSSSKYPASTMRPAASLAGLDTVGDGITFDSLMSIFPNLENLGIKQYEIMTYRDAMEEGIDVRPVTDEQKAIWSEYHK